MDFNNEKYRRVTRADGSLPSYEAYGRATGGIPSSEAYRLAREKQDFVNNQDADFDRVFNRTLGEEGGYEDRATHIDTPTNMGFQQSTLDRFKSAHPDLAQGYPSDISNLTYEQGRQIARKDFFDQYRIGEIQNQPLQETMFDSFFNHSPQAPAYWAQRAINQNTNMHVDEDGVFGSQTIGALNNLSQDEVIKVNNSIIDQRQADYEREKRTNPNPNYTNYTTGLPNRFDRFRIK